MITTLSWVVIIAVVLVIALCIPAIRAIFIWIAVFFVRYAPSIITVIIILLALVIFPAAVLWSIYGAPVLFVLVMLAIFAIWSSFAKWLLWSILIIGLLLSVFWQPTSTWLHKKLPAAEEWQKTSWETADTRIQESSLSMRNTITDSEVTKGTFGSISGNGVVGYVVGYDEFGKKILGLDIPNNQFIKATGKTIAQDKATGDEGLIQVMLPNKDGDFIGGRIIWIPIRNAVWKKIVKEEGMDTAPPATEIKSIPAAPAAPASPPKEVAPPVIKKRVAPPTVWEQPSYGQIYESRPAEVLIPAPLVVWRELPRPRYYHPRGERRFSHEQRRNRQERRFRHEPPPHYHN